MKIIETGQIPGTILTTICILAYEIMVVYLSTQPQIMASVSIGSPSEQLKNVIDDHTKNVNNYVFSSIVVIFALLFLISVVILKAGNVEFIWTRTICETTVFLFLQMIFIKAILLPLYIHKYELLTGTHIEVGQEYPDTDMKLVLLPLLFLITSVTMVIYNQCYWIIPSVLFHSISSFATEAIVYYLFGTSFNLSCLLKDADDNGGYVSKQLKDPDILLIVCVCMIAILSVCIYGIHQRNWPMIFQICIIFSMSTFIITAIGNRYKTFDKILGDLSEKKLQLIIWAKTVQEKIVNECQEDGHNENSIVINFNIISVALFAAVFYYLYK